MIWDNCQKAEWKDSAKTRSARLASLFMGKGSGGKLDWKHVDASGMFTFIQNFGFGCFSDGLRDRCLYLRQLRNQLHGHNRSQEVSETFWNRPVLTITSATLTVSEEKGDKKEHKLVLKCSEKTLTIPRKRADFETFINESQHGKEVRVTDKDIELVLKVRLYDDGVVCGKEKTVTLKAGANSPLVSLDPAGLFTEEPELRLFVQEHANEITITAIAFFGLVRDLIVTEFIDYPVNPVVVNDAWKKLLDQRHGHWFADSTGRRSRQFCL